MERRGPSTRPLLGRRAPRASVSGANREAPPLRAASHAPTPALYPGILRNSLDSDQNASPYITAPSRNGAPGSSTGAAGDVK